MRKLLCYVGHHNYTKKHFLGRHIEDGTIYRYLHICECCGATKVTDEKMMKRLSTDKSIVFENFVIINRVG